MDSIRQQRFQTAPDRYCKIFGAWQNAFHKVNVEIQISMVKRFANLPLYDLAEFFGIDKKSGIRIYFPLDGNYQLVVMTMPVVVGTLAENFTVFLSAPRRVREFMRGIKMLVAAEINHLVKLTHKRESVFISFLFISGKLTCFVHPSLMAP
jgi:hypothetical protein